jgi:hypothetical protein
MYDSKLLLLLGDIAVQPADALLVPGAVPLDDTPDDPPEVALLRLRYILAGVCSGTADDRLAEIVPGYSNSAPPVEPMGKRRRGGERQARVTWGSQQKGISPVFPLGAIHAAACVTLAVVHNGGLLRNPIEQNRVDDFWRVILGAMP